MSCISRCCCGTNLNQCDTDGLWAHKASSRGLVNVNANAGGRWKRWKEFNVWKLLECRARRKLTVQKNESQKVKRFQNHGREEGRSGLCGGHSVACRTPCSSCEDDSIRAQLDVWACCRACCRLRLRTIRRHSAVSEASKLPRGCGGYTPWAGRKPQSFLCCKLLWLKSLVQHLFNCQQK